MKLPHAADAVIDDRKVRDYLLAVTHPIGRAKAQFFMALGFHPISWRELQGALRTHVIEGEASPGLATPDGQTFVVQGTLRGPTGAGASVVSVCIIASSGDPAPRLVTAYPGDRL